MEGGGCPDALADEADLGGVDVVLFAQEADAGEDVEAFTQAEGDGGGGGFTLAAGIEEEDGEADIVELLGKGQVGVVSLAEAVDENCGRPFLEEGFFLVEGKFGGFEGGDVPAGEALAVGSGDSDAFEVESVGFGGAAGLDGFGVRRQVDDGGEEKREDDGCEEDARKESIQKAPRERSLNDHHVAVDVEAFGIAKRGDDGEEGD